MQGINLERIFLIGQNFDFIRYFQFGFANVTSDCAPCNCNKNGSVENYCDTHSGQCPCKMGIEGLQCDTCEDGYYNLTKDGCGGKFNVFITFSFIVIDEKHLVSHYYSNAIQLFNCSLHTFKVCLQYKTDFSQLLIVCRQALVILKSGGTKARFSLKLNLYEN